MPLDGQPMQEFIALLRDRHTVIDPTLMTFEGMFLDRPGRMGPTWYGTKAPSTKAINELIAALQGEPSPVGSKPSSSRVNVSIAVFGF